MHRQVGDLQMDVNGIAQKGLLVRHLLMPGDIAGLRPILDFIAEEISPKTYLNIMPQYRPCGDVSDLEFLTHGITQTEFDEALKMAKDRGLNFNLQ